MDNFARESYLEYVETVANMLESIAERVRRPVSPNESTVSHAASVVNEVAWGVANLHFDTLLRRAERADNEDET